MPKKQKTKQKQKQKQRQSQKVIVNIGARTPRERKNTDVKRSFPPPVVMTTPVYNLPPQFNQPTPQQQERLRDPNPPRGNVLGAATTLPLAQEVYNATPFAEAAAAGKRESSIGRLPILNPKRYAQIVAAGLMPEGTNEYSRLSREEKIRLKQILAERGDEIMGQRVAVAETVFAGKMGEDEE